MPEKVLTMEDDWGAKGAQATGAQVQAFIKGQLKDLINKCESLKTELDTLKSNPEEPTPQRRSADGCYVTCHDDDYSYAIPYWEWPIAQEQGRVADGVLVLIDGQAPIIISPTSTQLKWSEEDSENREDAVIADLKSLYTDFDGKTNTQSLLTPSSNLSVPAAHWCDSYDCPASTPGNPHLHALGGGKWWLPSVGELIAIWKNKDAINRCLAVISGANLIDECGDHWSSNEVEGCACSVSMTDGVIGLRGFNYAQYYVRAVTEYGGSWDRDHSYGGTSIKPPTPLT